MSSCDRNGENSHRTDDRIKDKRIVLSTLRAPTFKLFLLCIGGKPQYLKAKKKKRTRLREEPGS